MNIYNVTIDNLTYTVVAETIPAAVRTAEAFFFEQRGYTEDALKVESRGFVHAIEKGA